jgi:hypothetical protein
MYERTVRFLPYQSVSFSGANGSIPSNELKKDEEQDRVAGLKELTPKPAICAKSGLDIRV